MSGTDKGLHAQACVVPMYNNVINTPVQETVNSEISSCRAANEWDVGKTKNLFKFIGLFVRVCCVMANSLNILDEGQSAEFYSCQPPTLHEYFV
jgi:hypothetical protein